IKKPVCVVSGAKYLSDDGWTDLRNPLDTDVPFRMFRDEGRTYLQWVGEPDLRIKMSGRMIMVYLMCRELSTDVSPSTIQQLFTPCVAFRIVGSPSKFQSNVTEVAFIPEAHSKQESTSGDSLSVSNMLLLVYHQYFLD
ncbi:uncharacterized protein LOC115890543, partial [Sitophilus oryzae]|uniref:Uncharacterized protein LOC115890543 n=1 Tax=Sitophilus oryzae TaxID=7048 RepID=A0A6J2YU04_SITOR